MSTSEGKVAIVTGASRGIGKAIAERFAGDGFAVLVNYAPSAGTAEALVRTIVEFGRPRLRIQGRRQRSGNSACDV